MATLQQQARALGEPTRYEVFRYVAEASEPVGVAELAAHLGLHQNAVRQHLAKLVAAHLLDEAAASTGKRGRPRLVYRVAPEVDGRWGETGPYERLSAWLAEVVRTGDPPSEVGRRVGRRLRADRSGAEDPAADLVEQMARHGFEPTVRRRGREVDITLGHCPFESTALADPDTVCDLHLGMARGVAEGLGGLEVVELVRKDPRRAQCRLRCHLDAEGTAEQVTIGRR